MQIRIVIRWAPRFMSGQRRASGKIVDRLCCLVMGHRDKVSIGDHTLALQCARCGRKSAGWELDRHSPA